VEGGTRVGRGKPYFPRCREKFTGDGGGTKKKKLERTMPFGITAQRAGKKSSEKKNKQEEEERE